MKLTDIFENFTHSGTNESFDYEVYVVETDMTKYEILYACDIRISVKDYDTVVSDIAGVIRNTMVDIVKELSNKNGQGYLSISKITIVDDLNGGGSRILIGKGRTIWDYGFGGQSTISLEEPEEDINDLMTKVKRFKLPSHSECMTKIKRDHTIVKASTRMYDVQDINIELTLTPEVSSICQVQMKVPEDKDEDEVGLDLGQRLKPYKIRPQINGGPVIGTTPL